MWTIEIFIGLLIAIVVLVRFARWTKLPPAIPLLIGGIALSFMPGFDRIELAPEMVFTVFLPPLLFVAAYMTSWRDFKADARPIGLLAVGLVVATTLGVGIVAHWAIPGLPLAAAFAIGAVVSPTDAIAAASITELIGVPRRIVTILEGESLVNDATGIVAYRVAVAAAVTGTFSILDVGWQFVLSSAGGILVGLAMGRFLAYLLKKFDDAPVENTLTFITPFATYILAERILHVSGVLAVVAAGLVAARFYTHAASSETRLQGASFWQMLDFLFNGALFLLLGLQLRRIIGGLDGISLGQAIFAAVAIAIAAIFIRILWVYPASWLPRALSKKIRESDPMPPLNAIFLVGWTGMRGAISLAAALALPYTVESGAPFPQRNLIIFVAFTTILTTLGIQGLSLIPLIKLLKLEGDGETKREISDARASILRAALDKIGEIDDGGRADAKTLHRLESDYRLRLASVEGSVVEDGEPPDRDFPDERALRLEIIRIEREALHNLRRRGKLHEEGMRHLTRELDLEEQLLSKHQIPREM